MMAAVWIWCRSTRSVSVSRADEGSTSMAMGFPEIRALAKAAACAPALRIRDTEPLAACPTRAPHSAIPSMMEVSSAMMAATGALAAISSSVDPNCALTCVSLLAAVASDACIRVVSARGIVPDLSRVITSPAPPRAVLLR